MPFCLAMDSLLLANSGIPTVAGLYLVNGPSNVFVWKALRLLGEVITTI